MWCATTILTCWREYSLPWWISLNLAIYYLSLPGIPDFNSSPFLGDVLREKKDIILAIQSPIQSLHCTSGGVFHRTLQVQLSTQHMIQLEAYCFPNPWIFSSSTCFSSLFWFSFCSPEPGFFLFLYTYYSCCKHLLICNLPSETDCLFLSASSNHSLFSNVNQKHRFFSLPYIF